MNDKFLFIKKGDTFIEPPYHIYKSMFITYSEYPLYPKQSAILHLSESLPLLP